MGHSPQSDPRAETEEGIGVVVVGDVRSIEPYLAALTKLEWVRVVGWLDLSTDDDRPSAHTTARLQSTEDPATALEWDGVDAFIQCVPLTHGATALAEVANSGKPVFVESRAGRYRSDALTVRDRIEAGALGRVVFARFAAANSSDDALTTARTGREQLLWQRRAHVLDLLGWWIDDEPDTVYAQRNDDYESVTVRYADGATAVCDISTAGPPYREILVVGTSASISLCWADQPNVLLPASEAGPQFVDSSSSLHAVLDVWLTSVRTGTATVIDVTELWSAVALDGAIERSVASGLVADVETTQPNRSSS